jgi:hypothetical protein
MYTFFGGPCIQENFVWSYFVLTEFPSYLLHNYTSVRRIYFCKYDGKLSTGTIFVNTLITVRHVSVLQWAINRLIWTVATGVHKVQAHYFLKTLGYLCRGLPLQALKKTLTLTLMYSRFARILLLLLLISLFHSILDTSATLWRGLLVSPWFVVKFDIWEFFENLLIKLKFH